MFVMHRARQLARFVLVWFVMTLGVAMASPMIQPKAMDWVCASGGGMKLIVVGDDDTTSTAHTLDCPLCGHVSAAPPASAVSQRIDTSLARAVQPIDLARIAMATAPPLPSRGPPLASC